MSGRGGCALQEGALDCLGGGGVVGVLGVCQRGSAGGSYAADRSPFLN